MIQLACKICRKPCTISKLDDEWCHSDEEILLIAGVPVNDPRYDHTAIPDVIEAEMCSDGVIRMVK